MKSIYITIGVPIFSLLGGAVHAILLRSSIRSSSAFSVSNYCSPRRRQHHSPAWESRLFSMKRETSHDEGNEIARNRSGGEETKSWELMEDWILQDRVPDFTVGGTTFWRQLKHTIPELSTRTEKELEHRYSELAGRSTASSSPASRAQSPKNNRSKQQPEGTIGKPFIECGQSPDVLTNWWFDVVEQKKKGASTSTAGTTIMMMNGRLSNGSNIWFPLRSAGTVGDSSSPPEATSSGLSRLLEEGNYIKYVESSAGCIYELGIPKPDASTALVNPQKDYDETILLAGSENSLDQIKKWLSSSSARMGTVISTAVAASLLSATLAFNLGQVSLPSQPASTITPPQTNAMVVSRQSPSQIVTPALIGSGMKYERTVQKDGPVQAVELSIPEQRASQELLVFREERKLGNLRDKLKSDELMLSELKAQEKQLGAAAKEALVNVPRSPKELPVTEQRARAELKIGVDKRRISRMEDSIANNRVKLKELQRQEKQQGSFPLK